MTAHLLVAALASALLVGVAYAVWWLDRFRREPAWHFTALVALSAVAAVLLAVYPAASSWRESVAARVGTLSPALGELAGHAAGVATAALPGILLQALLVLVLTGRRWLLVPLDGLVVGVAAGSGFALAQNVVLVLSGGAAFYSWTAFRALLGAATLATFAAGIFWVRLTPRWPARAARLVVLLALATGAYVAGAIVGSFVFPPWGGVAWAIGLLAGAAWYALRRERAAVGAELAEEVALGMIPQRIAEIEPCYWRRIRSDWWQDREERRAINLLLTTLAFRKHQLRDLGGDQARLYSLEVGRLRERARRVFEPRRAEPVAE